MPLMLSPAGRPPVVLDNSQNATQTMTKYLATFHINHGIAAFGGLRPDASEECVDVDAPSVPTAVSRIEDLAEYYAQEYVINPLTKKTTVAVSLS